MKPSYMCIAALKLLLEIVLKKTAILQVVFAMGSSTESKILTFSQ